MTMRKIYSAFTVSALLLAITACVREPMAPVQESHAITASIAADGPQTRAILIDNPGVRMESYWAAGDRIGLAGSDGAVKAFQVSASDISADGKSAVFRSEETVPSGNLTAFFPYQEGAAVSGGKVVLDLPATQHYTLGRSLPQPDPGAALMVGTGSAETGISLCNVLSVLKVGQTFEKDVTVSRVEFRDLDGKAVAGRLTIDPSRNYASDLSGDDKVITLDCGEGVKLDAGVLGKFYFLVPARSYPKGVEITFILSDGQKIVKKSATTSGLTCSRGVVYPIGEATNREYAAGAGASKLASGAIMMTPEILRAAKIVRQGKERIANPDGGFVDYGGADVFVPYFEMILPGDLGLKNGTMLVFEATDDLPGGGVFVASNLKQPWGDEKHCMVDLHMTTEFAKAFESMEFGSEMFDAEGNEIEGAGLELDLGNYLSEVRDADGNIVPFTRMADGTIAFSANDMANVLTKALVRTEKTLTSPPLTISYEGNNCSATLGATLNVALQAAARITQGELDFVHFTFHPTINLEAEFSISKSWSFNKELHLLTLYCAPGIPVAPGVVLLPEMEIYGTLGAEANVKLSTKISYKIDPGRFGFSYQNGTGFQFRHFEKDPEEEEIHPALEASLTGTLSAYLGVKAVPSISLYGLLRAGLDTDFRMTLALTTEHSSTMETGQHPTRLTLTPSISFLPRTASLGGLFSKKWDKLKTSIEWDPIWERFIMPNREAHLTLTGTRLPMSHELYEDNYKLAIPNDGGYSYYLLKWKQGVPTPYHFFVGLDGIEYHVTSLNHPLLDDWIVEMEIITGGVGTADNGLWKHHINVAAAYGGDGFDLSSDAPRLSGPGDSYVLGTIPAGVLEDDFALDGYIPFKPALASGDVRGVRIKYTNVSTGISFGGSDSVPAFAFYWPKSPEGPFFDATRLKTYTYAEKIGTDQYGQPIYKQVTKTAAQQYREAAVFEWPLPDKLPELDVLN